MGISPEYSILSTKMVKSLKLLTLNVYVSAFLYTGRCTPSLVNPAKGNWPRQSALIPIEINQLYEGAKIYHLWKFHRKRTNVLYLASLQAGGVWSCRFWRAWGWVGVEGSLGGGGGWSEHSGHNSLKPRDGVTPKFYGIVSTCSCATS